MLAQAGPKSKPDVRAGVAHLKMHISHCNHLIISLTIVTQRCAKPLPCASSPTRPGCLKWPRCDSRHAPLRPWVRTNTAQAPLRPRLSPLCSQPTPASPLNSLPPAATPLPLLPAAFTTFGLLLGCFGSLLLVLLRLGRPGLCLLLLVVLLDPLQGSRGVLLLLLAALLLAARRFTVAFAGTFQLLPLVAMALVLGVAIAAAIVERRCSRRRLRFRLGGLRFGKTQPWRPDQKAE